MADRGYNQVTEFSPDGKQLRAFLRERAGTPWRRWPRGKWRSARYAAHLVTVFGPNGKIVREFGDPESLSFRPEINRTSEPRAAYRRWRGTFTTAITTCRNRLCAIRPIGLRRSGFRIYRAGCLPGSASRAERNRKTGKEIRLLRIFTPILTAFAVDPLNGDLWMALHNTLCILTRTGIRRSEYRIYTPEGGRLEANRSWWKKTGLLIGDRPSRGVRFRAARPKTLKN